MATAAELLIAADVNSVTFMHDDYMHKRRMP